MTMQVDDDDNDDAPVPASRLIERSCAESRLAASTISSRVIGVMSTPAAETLRPSADAAGAGDEEDDAAIDRELPRVVAARESARASRVTAVARAKKT